MLRVGLVGYGYWGPNLARNFNGNPDCALVRIADMSDKRRALAAATYPGVEVASDDGILTATDIDAVVGAGSVVTKSVPAGEIWAGNPARFLRKAAG